MLHNLRLKVHVQYLSQVNGKTRFWCFDHLIKSLQQISSKQSTA